MGLPLSVTAAALLKSMAKESSSACAVSGGVIAEVGVVLATDAAVLALLTVCVGKNRSLFIQPNILVPISIAAPAIIAVIRRCLVESLTDCEGGNTCDVVAAEVAGAVCTPLACGFGLGAMLLML